jgi:hypothetical protein
LVKAAIGDDSQLIPDAIVTLVKANDLISRNRDKPERIFCELLLEHSARTKLRNLHTDRLVGSSELSEIVLQSVLNPSILLELILQIDIRQSGRCHDCRANNNLKD